MRRIWTSVLVFTALALTAMPGQASGAGNAAAGEQAGTTDVSAQGRNQDRAARQAQPRRATPPPRAVAPRAVPQRYVAPRAVPPRAVVAPRRYVAPARVRFNPAYRRPLVIAGRPVTVVRGPHYVHWRGVRRSLVPLAVIGGITVGAVAYSAAGYVPIEAPYCVGSTVYGCHLRWQQVQTEDGFVVPQCVEFCPIE